MGCAPKPKSKDAWVPRWRRVKTCGECGLCPGTHCVPAKKPALRQYNGIRFTSDGFDCALPVTIDSHSMCSFGCLYCFSDNLSGHVQAREKGLGQTSLRMLENIFSGGGGADGAAIRQALKYDRRNAAGYPCPVQLGGINDPCDNIERNQGWLLEFIKLAIKYNQPVRISTKGSMFLVPEYLDAIKAAPHLFWIAFSIISPDDAVLSAIDLKAPPPSVRIKTMKALSDAGCSTSLRFRPILPGISDATYRYPKAYKTLVEMAAAAGAKAISYECGFYPSRIPTNSKWKWNEIERIAGRPLRQIYSGFGKKEACNRPSHAWTENIMHAIREVAHANGLTCGVSDPVWKQLTDVGCCCGIRPDDPVFGNWERENATWALMRARDDRSLVLRKEDIIPPWAYNVKLSKMVAMGAGAKIVYKVRHTTWADKLAEIWNDPTRERSPLNYFQGALVPVALEGGEVGYKYRGLERRNLDKIPYWTI